MFRSVFLASCIVRALVGVEYPTDVPEWMQRSIQPTWVASPISQIVEDIGFVAGLPPGAISCDQEVAQAVVTIETDIEVGLDKIFIWIETAASCDITVLGNGLQIKKIDRSGHQHVSIPLSEYGLGKRSDVSLNKLLSGEEDSSEVSFSGLDANDLVDMAKEYLEPDGLGPESGLWARGDMVEGALTRNEQDVVRQIFERALRWEGRRFGWQVNVFLVDEDEVQRFPLGRCQVTDLPPREPIFDFALAGRNRQDVAGFRQSQIEQGQVRRCGLGLRVIQAMSGVFLVYEFRWDELAQDGTGTWSWRIPGCALVQDGEALVLRALHPSGAMAIMALKPSDDGAGLLNKQQEWPQGGSLLDLLRAVAKARKLPLVVPAKQALLVQRQSGWEVKRATVNRLLNWLETSHEIVIGQSWGAGIVRPLLPERNPLYQYRMYHVAGLAHSFEGFNALTDEMMRSVSPDSWENGPDVIAGNNIGIATTPEIHESCEEFFLQKERQERDQTWIQVVEVPSAVSAKSGIISRVETWLTTGRTLVDMPAIYADDPCICGRLAEGSDSNLVDGLRIAVKGRLVPDGFACEVDLEFRTATDQSRTRDSRLIPVGGAAIYHIGERVIALVPRQVR